MKPVRSTPGPKPSLWKRALPLLVLLGLILLVGSSCITRVGAAQVGIRIKLAGSERGVENVPVVTGWVFYNRLTEQVIIFPTSVHTTVWTRDVRETSPIDESITFSSSEGVNINADVALSFHIDPAKAPHIYLRFRQTTLEALADGYIRNAVRDVFNIAASKRTVDRIYGSGKVEFLGEVKEHLQAKLAADGFLIDQLTFSSSLRLPENVVGAINRAMEATQLAIQAENRVRQVKAEADQAVTKAEGEAAAARAKARGEADAKLLRAEAEARANLLVRASTSPKVLQYRALERWNGRLPVMNGGGALPMLTLDAADISKYTGDDEKLAALLDDSAEPAQSPGGEEAPRDGPAKPDPKQQNAGDAPAGPSK
jgi:regulator of protease activity HflC (stomatin/prohibitin superfamily)